MSLEETLRDLHTVLEADIFTSDDNGVSAESYLVGKTKVEQMRKLLRRDKAEIRRARDMMDINYRTELRGWLTQAGNYLNLRLMDVKRFNSSYENMLAYYAGRVIDIVPSTIPEEVLVAQNRFMKYRSRRERGMAV